MTRYVDKKHGLTIGSGNVFFFRNEQGIIADDWKAIVWAQSYDFTQLNSVNLRCLTPPQQIMWVINSDGETKLSGTAVWWLEHNVSPVGDKWSTRPKPENMEDVIFFRRRTDALAFVTWIEKMLEGIKIGN